jgi:hypothetical protein
LLQVTNEQEMGENVQRADDEASQVSEKATSADRAYIDDTIQVKEPAPYDYSRVNASLDAASTAESSASDESQELFKDRCVAAAHRLHRMEIATLTIDLSEESRNGPANV